MDALSRLTTVRAPRPLRALGARPLAPMNGALVRPGCDAQALVGAQRQILAHTAPSAPAHGVAAPAPAASGDTPESGPVLAAGLRLQITVEIDLADLTLAMETFKTNLPASARLEARPTLALSQAQEPCASVALTARQWQILALIGEGLSSKAIARRLGLSHFTVRNHLSQILLTMGLASRQQARAAFLALTCEALPYAAR